ncbi:4416_t:CDS:2, partial [Scutellospora calospora]
YNNFNKTWKKIPLKAVHGFRCVRMYNKIPYTEEYELHRYYLIEDIKILYNEFMLLIHQNKDQAFIVSWELEKRMKGSIYMKEVCKYSKEQKKDLGFFEENSVDDHNQKYELDILYSCLGVKNAFSTTDQILLNEREFKNMRKSLIEMYPEIKKNRGDKGDKEG